MNGETRVSREFSPVLAGATARRVLTQLRHDPRTIAMMVAVPAVLMVLLRYVVSDSLVLNRVAPEYIGVFPFVIMFIVAAITTQRERARGTLERLMAMPLGKLDLLAGYGIAFGLMAVAQVTLVLVVSLTWLGVTLPGSAAPMAVIAVLVAILGMTPVLRWLSDILPLSYAVDAMQRITPRPRGRARSARTSRSSSRSSSPP